MQAIATRLPDVIGIGFRRCGSSMLHEAMNEHPEIRKPPRGLHYFSEHFEKGEQWYAEQFTSCERARRNIEFSVSYTYPEHCEAAADRIYRLIPDAKLFVTVRNPIDRAYSDYLRSIRLCEIDQHTTFEEAIESHPVLLERGRYGRLLTPYLKLFAEDQVFIMLLDDLDAAPDRFWNSLWEFLGIDASVRPAEPKNRGGARSVRWAGLNRSIFAVKSVVDSATDKLGMTPAWKGIKRLGTASYRRFLALNTLSVEMNTTTRKRLAIYYRNDIQAIERLTGRSLDNWLTLGAN